jgi:hypothetical protein
MAAWVKDSKCYSAVGRRLFTDLATTVSVLPRSGFDRSVDALLAMAWTARA